MMKCKTNVGLVFLAMVLLIVSAHASASIILVENVIYDIAVAQVYNSSVGFTLGNLPAITAGASVYGSGGYYRYSFNNATVTLTPCALQSDNSTAPVAEGEFAGGATLTITGDLYDNDTGITYLTGGTILQAQMVKTAGETWTIAEDAGAPRNFDGSADFIPFDDGLSTGIVVSNGDILKIDNFDCDFSFTSMNPTNPDDFSMPFMLGTAISLQITAVPEPCTILLMAVGGFGLLRNRKK